MSIDTSWRAPAARRRVLAAACLVAACCPARAHNLAVHQGMTDYAYHLVLAMSQTPEAGNLLTNELTGLLDEPGMPAFFDAAGAAVPKLRALPSGLPEDPAPCWASDGNILELIVDADQNNIPDWPDGGLGSDGLPRTLAEQPMTDVIYPVTPEYGRGTQACQIDRSYRPIGSTAFVNPATGDTPGERFRSRDHTGVTLGYQATQPDNAATDWKLRYTTVEFLQNDGVTAATGAGTSALAFLTCTVVCGFFPPACAACPAAAIAAGAATVDGINDIDTTEFDHDAVTLGHFVDVKPLGAGDVVFDIERGKYAQKAGPNGEPDLLEYGLMAAIDLVGAHVVHDQSLAATNYEIFVAGTGDDDFHPDSVDRSAAQWQEPTAADTQFTALDNLAFWGWREFQAKHPVEDQAALVAHRLGWPLHAIGDASSPMHAMGATGYGHRPYEDAIEWIWGGLVHQDLGIPGAAGASARQAREIVSRAFSWRQFILQWRKDNGDIRDVPVRDLVTALANQSFGKGLAQPAIFDADASWEYQFGSKSQAIRTFIDNPAIVDVQRDTVLDGVALKVAFLISAMEVLP